VDWGQFQKRRRARNSQSRRFSICPVRYSRHERLKAVAAFAAVDLPKPLPQESISRRVMSIDTHRPILKRRLLSNHNLLAKNCTYEGALGEQQ
jgi:hypothetical protein